MNIRILLGLIIFMLLAGLINQFYFRNNIQRSNESTVTINGKTFNVDLAITDEEKIKGLGGREKMSENEGMLFVFDKAGPNGFWMNGMKIPLDIIFINDSRVVAVYENLPPPKAGESNLPAYGADVISDRVLEINAGLADKYDIKVGDEVKFNFPRCNSNKIRETEGSAKTRC